MEQELEAAGIAPVDPVPQVIFQQYVCVDRLCQWLHYVCTDASLAGLVVCWHRLSVDVRAAIMELVKNR
jgi:hypothetical protein